MDQNETWHAGRPRPGHMVLDGDPAPLHQNGAEPQFSAHTCCDQMDAWIKMPLGREVGLSPSDIVLDGDPVPPLPSFLPISVVAKWLDGSRCHLVGR